MKLIVLFILCLTPLTASAIGGKVSTPKSASDQFYVYVAKSGKVFLMNTGPVSNPQAGLWIADAAVCETTLNCAWSPLRNGAPTYGGSYVDLREMVDVDATHEIGIFGFNGNSGKCINCSIQVLNTATGSYTPVTLPGKRTGESPVCMTHDSSGIFYTMTNYHAGIWKSTNSSALVWTSVSSNWQTLKGVPPNSGNIYTCKVYGKRIYFGGEGGVVSCDLNFSTCSNDYLPFGNGKRNFTGILADVDEGNVAGPVMMLECCKQDTTVANYVPVSRFAGGKWVQLTTTSGITPYGQGLYFETQVLAIGVGATRRYYFINFGSAPPMYVYASKDASGTSFAPFKPVEWPISTAAYSIRQMSANPNTGAIWAIFQGSGGAGVYVTQ